MKTLFLFAGCGGLDWKLPLSYSSLDIIIESVDSISRDERDVPLMQYITNA